MLGLFSIVKLMLVPPGFGVGYEKYTQTQRLEQCMYPGAPCSFLDPHYSSSCLQKHNFVRLLAYTYEVRRREEFRNIFCQLLPSGGTSHWQLQTTHLLQLSPGSHTPSDRWLPLQSSPPTPTTTNLPHPVTNSILSLRQKIETPVEPVHVAILIIKCLSYDIWYLFEWINWLWQSSVPRLC